MSVYITARSTVTHKEKYENEFLPAVVRVHQMHGCKTIASGYANYILGGPAEDGARIAVIECPNEAAARALVESVKPIVETMQCLTNMRVSIVPAYSPEMATA